VSRDEGRVGLYGLFSLMPASADAVCFGRCHFTCPREGLLRLAVLVQCNHQLDA
jgi:hypothetical protein